ncbi:DeoR/GlpR family DNA-binding transcription regulator [Larsenimonas rhizosphaerae]|uniref:DeoR/GlpR family DNA-binding transcription regulator n=1 Tax=Larsenimonas rhizosphaerae TaxID=2944682 RepID=A0AA41ZGN7_9GAMM|nr:DeoR/GlpR family DNA-binding transcription regulator [Larsenimonas rhizosphaerae]MCX2524200.1 DeoR/GlpR family DNA-binding transcription regulator [Larsenimonas rhizosphaerae]
MLTRQRQSEILTLLKQEGQVVARTLSERFGVSEDTIRRDLRELAREGRLQRVHGGALPASSAVADFAQRQTIESGPKRAIAAAAAAMIEDGQVVLVDGGTTTVEMMRQLRPELVATVVTHSPSIAVELVNHPGIEVVMIGGTLFKHSIVTVGAAAIEALSHIRADVFFMGVTGVHETAGFSTGDLEEAYMKRALAAQAAETVVLASSDKLNAASRYRIGALSMAATLVVERQASAALTDPLARAGLSVMPA